MGRDPAERALALASLARWPGLDRELEAPTRYRRTGGLRLALDEAAWRAAGPWVAEQRADGVAVEVVDAQGARALAPGIAAGCLGGVYAPEDGQAEALPATEAFARAARRSGARVEEGAAVRALAVDHGRVVGVERGDGAREACDVAIVAGGGWRAALLAGIGVLLPIETRPLQMLLTAPGAPALRPVLGAFDRRLSLKQLDDGAYLIGGGWPARVTDHAGNRYEMLEESVAGGPATARAGGSPGGGGALARGGGGRGGLAPGGLPVPGPGPGGQRGPG